MQFFEAYPHKYVAVASQSLNGASSWSIAIPAGVSMRFQAALATNATYRLYARNAAAGGSATALTTATFLLLDGHALEISGGEGGTTVYFLLTNATGTAANGGANDCLLQSRIVAA